MKNEDNDPLAEAEKPPIAADDDPIQVPHELMEQSKNWAEHIPGKIKVFSMNDLESLDDDTQSAKSELSNRNRDLNWRLQGMGPHRRFFILMPALKRLESIQTEMPNFSAVVEEIKGYVALSRKTVQPLRIPPMLLLGPPGIGKSHFCRRLADALGVPHHWQAMDNSQGGETLAGSETFWSNTQTGLVFRAVAMGDHASPLILLDELDKAQRGGFRGDTLSVLHTLLEPETARHFKDASYPLPIDASHVIWIATANQATGFDSVLLSRFSVHEIEPLTREQSRMIAERLLTARLRECELEGQIYPGQGFLDALSLLTPREQHKGIERALGRAILKGQSNLLVDDLPKQATAATNFGFAPKTKQEHQEKQEQQKYGNKSLELNRYGIAF
ncbi:AAA family ATPase [Acidithiobacillus thiooxidans]|uniref:AAA family ATPase n=1 Tax=Acidithiobacillus thiooxidans TaxID=930 RepID=UPI0009D941AB|nr:AAA family ATPase [Acidithiobacillus thiooxidans]